LRGLIDYETIMMMTTRNQALVSSGPVIANGRKAVITNAVTGAVPGSTGIHGPTRRNRDATPTIRACRMHHSA